MPLETLRQGATDIINAVVETKIDPREELREAGFNDATIESL
jgi:hypothetical protein